MDENILKKLKETIISFSPQNIHELFYLYCYMLWNGYLSQNNYFEYNDKELYEEIDENTFKDYKVYSGCAICKHIAHHLYKVLKNMNVSSSYFELYLKDIKGIKLMNIKRNSVEIIETPNNEFIGHSTVFTQANSSTYILDLTNLCEIEIIKNKEIYYPNGEYILDEQLFKRKLPNIKYNEQSTINKEKLKEYYNNMKKKCLVNKKILDELYQMNQKNYKEISKKLEYFKI